MVFKVNGMNEASMQKSVEERRCPKAESWVVPTFQGWKRKRNQQRGLEGAATEAGRKPQCPNQ